MSEPDIPDAAPISETGIPPVMASPVPGHRRYLMSDPAWRITPSRVLILAAFVVGVLACFHVDLAGIPMLALAFSLYMLALLIP